MSNDWMRSCHFFLHCKSVLEISHLVVFLFHRCITFLISVSLGACEVISDLNGSLGSQHFFYVVNERTSFAL